MCVENMQMVEWRKERPPKRGREGEEWRSVGEGGGEGISSVASLVVFVSKQRGYH
jgi:hypothetical protein